MHLENRSHFTEYRKKQSKTIQQQPLQNISYLSFPKNSSKNLSVGGVFNYNWKKKHIPFYEVSATT